MSERTQAPPASPVPEANGHAWHTLTADRVLTAEVVDEQQGLSSAEAASRAGRFGPNTFATSKSESRWHAFIRQFADPMQIVLLVAGIFSLYPLKEWETGILLIFLTLFNAVLGLRQEGKAAAATAALQKMMIVKAKVTRDGRLEEIPAQELVGLVMGVGTLGVISWAEQERTQAVAHTMGVVTFSLFSKALKRRTAA